MGFIRCTRLIAILPCLMAVAGCGKGIAGGPAVVLNPIASNSTGAAFNLRSQGLLPRLDEFARLGTGLLASRAEGYGDAGVESMSYAIWRIQLCDSISVSGTAYQSNGSCATLYSAPYSQSDYDSNNVTSPYLDMMDMPAVKATINRGVAISAGTYNYGLVDWFKPIRIKGSVELNNSAGTLRTRSTGTSVKSGANGSGPYIETPDLDTASEAEVATVLLNNGGAWLKFQDPFVYDGSEPVTIDLVFNPDNLLKGASACSNCSIRKSENGPGILVPMLKLTPVPRKASETTRKEVYVIENIAGYNARIRMELYYIAEDSAKTIKGVELRTEYLAGVDSMYMDPPQVFSISTSGATIALKNWQNKDIITFSRLNSEGATGSATLNCTNGELEVGVCPASANGVVSGDLTLSKIVDVK